MISRPRSSSSSSRPEAVSPAAAGPASSQASASSRPFEAANGSSGGIAAYAGTEGSSFLRSGWGSTSERRKKDPLLSGFRHFPCVIMEGEQAAGHRGQPARAASSFSFDRRPSTLALSV